MLKLSQSLKSFCSYPFTRLKFTPDGYVTMCCFQSRKCLGNILETPLEKIWSSPLAREVRAATLAGSLHQTCRIPSCPFFHRPDKSPLDVEFRDYPTQFEIDLPIQHCNIGGETPGGNNLACVMCERNRPFAPQPDRLDEVCLALRPHVRHVNSIHIQGIAEAFWKDRIFDIIGHLGVEKYRDKVRISTTTNGTLMAPSRRSRFLQLPLSNVTWSIDAATPETYRKIRRVDMYDRIVANLKAYGRERDPTRQYMHIHNNINTINIGEVVQMVELAAEVGVNCLDFNATYGWPDICVNRDNIHLFREAQVKIMDASKRLGVYTTFMRDLVLDFEPAPKWEDIDIPLPELPGQLVQITMPGN